MYTVKVTHTRPSVDVPFYWETNLADHETYLTTLKSHYDSHLTLEDRIYSDDRLTVTQSMTADSIEEYTTGRTLSNNDVDLVKYWLTRDEYNYNNNISKILTEI